MSMSSEVSEMLALIWAERCVINTCQILAFRHLNASSVRIEFPSHEAWGEADPTTSHRRLKRPMSTLSALL